MLDSIQKLKITFLREMFQTVSAKISRRHISTPARPPRIQRQAQKFCISYNCLITLVNCVNAQTRFSAPEATCFKKAEWKMNISLKLIQ
jgi:hypothetical protein